MSLVDPLCRARAGGCVEEGHGRDEARPVEADRHPHAARCWAAGPAWPWRSGPRRKDAAAKPAPGAPPRDAGTVYDGGLKPGWKDIGWAPRELPKGAPARLRMFNYGGWILYRPKLPGAYGALSFRFTAPESYGEFLDVRLDAPGAVTFPHVRISAGVHRQEGPRVGGGRGAHGGPQSARPALRPPGVPRVEGGGPRLGALRQGGPGAAVAGRGRARAPPGGGRMGRGATAASREDCQSTAPRRPRPSARSSTASRFDGCNETKDTHQWKLGATVAPLGRQPHTRYNWKLGNAWNTANDWYFRNVDYTGHPSYACDDVPRDQPRRTACRPRSRVPMIGWVAKDTTSVRLPGRPSSARSRTMRPGAREAGNGVRLDGQDAAARRRPPHDQRAGARPSSSPSGCSAIRAKDKTRGAQRAHVHPRQRARRSGARPTATCTPSRSTYDELLERTIAYGTARAEGGPRGGHRRPRRVGLDGLLLLRRGLARRAPRLQPDRRAHGDVPLLAWYLRKLREHEKKTGVRLLDVVDVHFYPQANVGLGRTGSTDPDTARAAHPLDARAVGPDLQGRVLDRRADASSSRG